MPRITDLPLEILHQIIQELAPNQLASLSNLSLTCRSLYLHILPHLYHTLRIRYHGESSWGPRSELLRRLAPKGTYEVPHRARPSRGESSDVEPTPVDRKGKGVAGRPPKPVPVEPAAPSPSVAMINGLSTRELALMQIRNMVIDGYWFNAKEATSEEYWASEEGRSRQHQPTIDALEGLLWSLKHLEGFAWKITHQLPDRITAAVARFPMLKTVTFYGDTHLYASAPEYPYHSTTTLTNNPTHFGNSELALVTVQALETGDINQVVQWGDVIRTPKTWGSLRNLEFDMSPGFISMMVEQEPLEPDILCALFRPPPPAPGMLEPPKLTLHQLKMKEVPFQKKGIETFASSLDAGELRDLDFYYCQAAADLLQHWEKNRLKNLERLFIKEEQGVPYLARFLKQFGREGTCRNLKTLELCCWHVDQWNNMLEPMYSSVDSSMYPGYDSDSDGWGDMGPDYDDEEYESDWGCPCPYHGSHMVRPKSTPNGIPQPWKNIKDLAGSKAGGWGLERLVLDLRPTSASSIARQIPRQQMFLESFWRLRELALPVSYDQADRWNEFVEAIARLPNLESLYLLNARGDVRSHRNHPFPALYPLTGVAGAAALAAAHAHAHVHATAPSARGRSSRKKKATEEKDQPDKQYVDALTVAAKNRLERHGDGVSSGPGTSSSAAAAVARSWSGRLRHIGIRNVSMLGNRQPTRVWRIEVTNEPKVEPVPAAERRMSLRSSKKRKTETDWREMRDGDKVVRLREIVDEEKWTIANGLFKGMDRLVD